MKEAVRPEYCELESGDTFWGHDESGHVGRAEDKEGGDVNGPTPGKAVVSVVVGGRRSFADESPTGVSTGEEGVKGICESIKDGVSGPACAAGT